MGSESDQTMLLLQEKATLKKLDEDYAASTKTPEAKSEHRQRQKRHAEISREILELANMAKQ